MTLLRALEIEMGSVLGIGMGSVLVAQLPMISSLKASSLLLSLSS